MVIIYDRNCCCNNNLRLTFPFGAPGRHVTIIILPQEELQIETTKCTETNKQRVDTSFIELFIGENQGEEYLITSHPPHWRSSLGVHNNLLSMNRSLSRLPSSARIELQGWLDHNILFFSLTKEVTFPSTLGSLDWIANPLAKRKRKVMHL